MKKVLLFAIIATFSFNLLAQPARTDFDLSSYGVSITPDKRLITVLASLEVAGIQTPLSKQGEAFRTELRNDFRGISPDLRQKMKLVIDQYAKRHANASPGEIVSAFVSLSYSLSPTLDAPERSLDLPDDLLEVLDYSTLVAEFYKSPGVSQKIDGYYSKYQKAGSNLNPTAKEMVREVLDYLHTKPELTYYERIKVASTRKNKKNAPTKIQTREHNRSFKIVPEMLAPRGSVNFLNIRDSYFAVISPDTDLSSSEVRRAYLQFVLDPLVLSNARGILSHSDGIKKLLNQRRKDGSSISPDPLLAVSRSLVAAADIREEQFRRERLATSQARKKIELLNNDVDKKAVVTELERVKSLFADEAALQLSESYEKGVVLAFYFANKLKGIEDSGFDIASSLKDWITEINTSAEKNRLSENTEARQRAAAERKRRGTSTVIETTLVNNPLTEALLKIDKDIGDKNLTKAGADLNALLKKYPTGAARIYYSLGRVASISAEGLKDSKEVNVRLIKAKNFFERTIGVATVTTDGELISLAYVSLGRIYEFYDQKDYALKIYETAMQFGSIEGEGFKKAFEAKQKLVSQK